MVDYRKVIGVLKDYKEASNRDDWHFHRLPVDKYDGWGMSRTFDCRTGMVTFENAKNGVVILSSIWDGNFGMLLDGSHYFCKKRKEKKILDYFVNSWEWVDLELDNLGIWSWIEYSSKGVDREVKKFGWKRTLYSRENMMAQVFEKSYKGGKGLVGITQKSRDVCVVADLSHNQKSLYRNSSFVPIDKITFLDGFIYEEIGAMEGVANEEKLEREFPPITERVDAFFKFLESRKKVIS